MRSSASPRPAASPWVVFIRRWGAWAVIGIALMFTADAVALGEEVLGSDGESEVFLGADIVVLRLVARLRRPWLNGLAVDLGGILLGTSLGLLMAAGLRHLDRRRDERPPLNTIANRIADHHGIGS